MFSVVTNFFWCVVGFLETYNGTVTAIATVFIGVFTYVLARVTIRQAKLTQAAIDLGNREFISTHRPRLRAQNFIIHRERPPQGGTLLPMFQPGYVVRGQFNISNVGTSRADILNGHCMVWWGQGGLPMTKPYEDGVDNLVATERTLLSGQSTVVTFQSVQEVGQRMVFGRSIIGGFDLCVMGWVSYADRNNDVRRTTFCRQYFAVKGPGGQTIGPEGRFYPVDNPDYEQED